jgi:hypothetical protein
VTETTQAPPYATAKAWRRFSCPSRRRLRHSSRTVMRSRFGLADPDTAAGHLQETSTLAARMDTEVGIWAHLWLGPTNVGIRKKVYAPCRTPSSWLRNDLNQHIRPRDRGGPAAASAT